MNDQILSPSNPSVRQSTRGYPLIEFSPDEALAAFAGREENTILIFEIPSSPPRLVLDTGIHIDDLGITGSGIVMIGQGK